MSNDLTAYTQRHTVLFSFYNVKIKSINEFQSVVKAAANSFATGPSVTMQTKVWLVRSHSIARWEPITAAERDQLYGV